MLHVFSTNRVKLVTRKLTEIIKKGRREYRRSIIPGLHHNWSLRTSLWPRRRHRPGLTSMSLDGLRCCSVTAAAAKIAPISPAARKEIAALFHLRSGRGRQLFSYMSPSLTEPKPSSANQSNLIRLTAIAS